MKKRILFNISYFLLWVFYFVLARIFFLVFYFDKTAEVGFTDTLKACFYGLRLDASFAAYLSVIPFLIILFSVFIPNKTTSFLLKVFTFPIIFLITFLVIVDIGLYQSWGVRIDSTLMNYLNTPEIMWASTTTSQAVFGGLFWVILSVVFCYLFNKRINNKVLFFSKGKIFQTLVFFNFYSCFNFTNARWFTRYTFKSK